MRDIERRYKILILLREGRRTAQWLAIRIGVSVRTIYRWVGRLRGEGYAVAGLGGKDGGLWLEAEGRPVPLELHADDVRSIAMAVGATEGPGALLEAVIDVLPPERARRVKKMLAEVAGERGWPQPSPGVLGAIERGIGRHRALLAVHRRPGGATMERLYPRELTLSPEGWAVRARDMRDGEIRSFLLDELAGARLHPEWFVNLAALPTRPRAP